MLKLKRAAIVCFIVSALLTIGLVQSLYGQGVPLPYVQQEFFGATGTAAPLGFVCTYEAGTTTPLATYSDVGLTVANQNPIRLNAAGRPSFSSSEVQLFVLPQSYKIVVYSAGIGNTCNGTTVGAVVSTRDNILPWTYYTQVFATKLDDKVCHASQYTGANEGAKVAACIAVLPSTGGTIDGRGLEGAGTYSTNIWSGITKPVTLILGAGTKTVSANTTVPVNVKIRSDAGAILSPSGGVTLTLANPPDAGLYQIFAGAGSFVIQSGEVYPQWWGAKGDGSTNDTSAIKSAIDSAYTDGVTVRIVPGAAEYMLSPATVTSDAAGAGLTAFVIRSNMHVVMDDGAVMKIANTQSTSASPVRLFVFHSSAATANWSIVGKGQSVIDLNWENNKINPIGGPWSNGYTQAAIAVSGDSARADDVLIEGLTIQNHGGTCTIVAGQSNAALTVLGQRWTVRNNIFHNVGMNSTDFSGMFAWIDDAEFSSNTLYNDAVPVLDPGAGDWGKGLLELYEVHGIRHRVFDNKAWNSNEGFRVSGNYTSAVRDVLIANNVVDSIGYGTVIDWYVTGVPQPMVGIPDSILITGNLFRIGNAAGFYAGNSVLQSCISVITEAGPSNLTITGNHCHKSGTDDASAFVQLGNLSTTTTGPSNIVIANNAAQGTTFGVHITSQDAAGVGATTIKGNTWSGLLAAAGSSPIGLYVTTPTGAATLIEYSGNTTNTAAYGLYIDTATITTLYLGVNEFNTIATLEYAEAGAVTITNKRGFWTAISYTPTWTNVTGTATGQWTALNDNWISFTARVAVTAGSTGTIAVSLPFTSRNSNSQTFLGEWTIYDDNAGFTYGGILKIGAAATTATLAVNGAADATANGNPITLASPDIVTVSGRYLR